MLTHRSPSPSESDIGFLRYFSKAIASITFAAIAVAAVVYGALAADVDFATIVVVAVSALAALGFALATWADSQA